MQTELESLQNFGDKLGMVIHEQFKEDKRKTIKTYFATLNNISISPMLDYEQLNHFLLGWYNSLKQMEPFKI